MKRMMLIVAYDGTNYHGWQKQPNGETIEGVLNRCLSGLLREEIEVIGASRTDSGVHALCNVAVFDTDTDIPPERLAYALNARLPADIKIQGSKEVPLSFHPRHCDSRKTYEYRIYNAELPMPTERLYAHFSYVPYDVERMREAAAYFVGTHDFKSFCSTDTHVENTVRQLERVEVEKTGRLITIRVTGRGFLYNMVRIMAGTLMEVGRGSLEPQEVERILEARDRSAAGPTAPACGLTLVGYEFLQGR
ncbi:MAG: tRNA pseudouridine(38-40) synthase TruA [Blautia sp.]|nr:tRNA pseudouridine(38-40) synthase TruA [Blautia sp.]MCM1200067.1 tRNA pseudouridine(38-40) synthase TruA [Bacteroides fragilis]